MADELRLTAKDLRKGDIVSGQYGIEGGKKLAKDPRFIPKKGGHLAVSGWELTFTDGGDYFTPGNRKFTVKRGGGSGILWA